MHGPNWLRCAFQIGCVLLIHEDEENGPIPDRVTKGQALGAVMKWLNCPPHGQLPYFGRQVPALKRVGRGKAPTKVYGQSALHAK